MNQKTTDKKYLFVKILFILFLDKTPALSFNNGRHNDLIIFFFFYQKKKIMRSLTHMTNYGRIKFIVARERQRLWYFRKNFEKLYNPRYPEYPR